MLEFIKVYKDILNINHIIRINYYKESIYIYLNDSTLYYTIEDLYYDSYIDDYKSKEYKSILIKFNNECKLLEKSLLNNDFTKGNTFFQSINIKK